MHAITAYEKHGHDDQYNARLRAVQSPVLPSDRLIVFSQAFAGRALLATVEI